MSDRLCTLFVLAPLKAREAAGESEALNARSYAEALVYVTVTEVQGALTVQPQSAPQGTDEWGDRGEPEVIEAPGVRAIPLVNLGGQLRVAWTLSDGGAATFSVKAEAKT